MSDGIAVLDEPIQAETGPIKTLDLPDEHVLAVDVEKRLLKLRVVRYNQVVEHPIYGALMFEPGAFGSVDAAQVRLRLEHQNPPTGLGQSYEDGPTENAVVFKVAKTARGDEQLTLAREQVVRGTSPGFTDIPGRPQQKVINGRLTTVYGPNSAVLAEVSTTWMPTFPGDGVHYVLSQDEKGDGPVAETQEGPVAAPVITPGFDYERMAETLSKALSSANSESKMDAILAKFDEMTELQRAQFTVPQGGEARKPKLHHWVGVALRRMAGESISPTELKELALDDVVTGEQPGLVPNRLVPDYNDIIDKSRPFLESTRRVDPPATGTSLILPIITTRAVAGTQENSAEKGALTTTATKVGTGTFAYKSVFGGADISLQMIRRADRSFFDLLTGDMGEAYALDCELKALSALLTGYTDSATNVHSVVNGGNLDVESPNFGEAWKNSIAVAKRAPTHIWMSSTAVAAFIDAKAPLTNAPLYSNLAASFTAGGGPGGRISGLIPVYVPAMDANLKVDVIVGPSTGFVWAEDPALTLEADRPDVAGRDIALVGGIFPAPRYADAFTKYNIAVS